jgi:hypothetical protein
MGSMRGFRKLRDAESSREGNVTDARWFVPDDSKAERHKLLPEAY